MTRFIGEHNRKWKISMMILIAASLVLFVGGFTEIEHLPSLRSFSAAAVLAILARIVQAHYHNRDLLGNPEIDLG